MLAYHTQCLQGTRTEHHLAGAAVVSVLWHSFAVGLRAVSAQMTAHVKDGLR